MSPGIALCEAGSRGLSAGGFCRAELAWCEPRRISLRWARIAQAGLGSAPAQDRADPDLRATASDETRIAAPLLTGSPEMLRGGAGAADAQDVIAGPLLVEMCISLSSGAFCTRERRLELHFRVRSARFGARGGAGPASRSERSSWSPSEPAAALFVQICCKGPDRTGALEEKRWYSAILLAADPGPERLCNRFGHAPARVRPRSPTRTTARPLIRTIMTIPTRGPPSSTRGARFI